jgi:hypothetical protein
MLWHNGGTGGFRSFISFAPDTSVGVVVLSNSARSFDAIGFRIRESIGRTPRPAAAPGEPRVQRVFKPKRATGHSPDHPFLQKQLTSFESQ